MIYTQTCKIYTTVIIYIHIYEGNHDASLEILRFYYLKLVKIYEINILLCFLHHSVKRLSCSQFMSMIRETKISLFMNYVLYH